VTEEANCENCRTRGHTAENCPVRQCMCGESYVDVDGNGMCDLCAQAALETESE
jgi:hypothetical protein